MGRLHKRGCGRWRSDYCRCLCGVVEHEPIPYENTIAARAARYPGFAEIVATARAGGSIYLEPTLKLLECQAEKRAAHAAALSCPWPGSAFNCVCGTRLWRHGDVCPDCGEDGFNWLHVFERNQTMILFDEFDDNKRYYIHFDGRPEEPVPNSVPYGGMWGPRKPKKKPALREGQRVKPRASRKKRDSK